MTVIITDACCDLPKDYCENNNIEIIPMTYNVNGQDYIYDLKSADLKDFYQLMKNGAVCTTSQININNFIEFFTPLLKAGKDIIYIAFSSGLSGTYNNARLAAEELRPLFPKQKIYICDSLCASMGEGLFVHYAAELLKQNKTFEEITSWLEAHKQNINHWFTVDDLHHLKRGGRISGTVAIVGSILSIKPVMHADSNGKLIPRCKKKGRKHALEELFYKLEDQGVDINTQTIFISHGDYGDCENDAEFVKTLIKQKYPNAKFLINYIGPVVGSHSGPGTVALFFYGSHR